MMLAALFASTLILQGTIDYETRAKSLQSVLTDLSTQTGQTLVANPPMNKEIIVLSVHAKPLDEVMARLAQVTLSRAEKTPKGWKLIADPRVREAESRRLLSARIDEISRAQRSLLQRMESEPPFDTKSLVKQVVSWEERFGRNDNQPDSRPATDAMRLAAPGNRAMRRIVASLDPVTLAQIPIGGCLVFSNLPRRMQLRLDPAVAKSGLEQAATEQTAWANVYRNGGVPERNGYMIGGDPRGDTEPFEAADARFVLKATRINPGELPSFQGFCVDREGTILLSAYTYLGRDLAKAPPAPKAPVPEIDEPELKFTDEAIAHTGSLPALISPLPARPLSPAMRQVMLDPARNEPLGFAVSELLIGAAKSRKADLVACVPDFAIEWLRFFGDGKGGFRSHKPSLLLPHLFGATLDIQNDWLSLRPNDDAPGRTNREALANLLRSIDREGCIRLDPYAEFVSSSEDLIGETISHHLCEAIAPGSSTAHGNTLGESLRLYSDLGPVVRQRLRKGERLRVKDLPAAVRSRLETIIFRRNPPDFVFFARDIRLSRFLGDPTEILPNGLPEDSEIAMEVTSEDALLVETNDSNYPPRPLSVDALAMHRVARELNLQGGRNPLQNQTITLVRPGQRVLLKTRWTFGASIHWSQSFYDSTFDLRKPGIDMSALTPEWRQKIDAKTEQFRQYERQQNQGGTGVPPPRP